MYLSEQIGQYPINVQISTKKCIYNLIVIYAIEIVEYIKSIFFVILWMFPVPIINAFWFLSSWVINALFLIHQVENILCKLQHPPSALHHWKGQLKVDYLNQINWILYTYRNSFTSENTFGCWRIHVVVNVRRLFCMQWLHKRQMQLNIDFHDWNSIF